MNSLNLIPWRTRSDLVSVSATGDSGTVVKDPLKNEFYEFSEIEFFILNSLKSTHTLESLQQHIFNDFDAQIDPSEIGAFVQRLGELNLARRLGLNDGKRLLDQSQRQSWFSAIQPLLGFLSIRFPGIYPGRLLQLLRPVGFLLFNPASLILFTIIVVATILFAVLNIQSLAEKVPTLAALVAPDHLFILFIGFVLVKIFHELGHALSCQFVGRECTEIGLMLLVFMPCLYCDVSDIWQEKSRRKRILVSLAGVLVELFVAVVCFWMWQFSIEGKFSAAMFSLMIVTSLNTVFINGNPLMKFDGYYVLADAFGVSNLASESRNAMMNFLKQVFTVTYVKATSQSRWLVAYGFSVIVYRFFILFAIAIGVYSVFDSVQLSQVGRLFVAMLLFVSILPLAAVFQQATRTSFRSINYYSIAALIVSLMLLSIFVLKLTFNYRVNGIAELRAAGAEPVFAPADGFFQSFVTDGDNVTKNQHLGQIDSFDVEIAIAEIESRVAEIDQQLESLVQQNGIEIAARVEFLKEQKQSRLEELGEANKRLATLEIKSPSNGLLMSRIINVTDPLDNEEIRTNDYFFTSGHMTYLQRGDLIGYVGSPDTIEGFAKIAERDIQFVRIGQSVRVMLGPSVTTGKVTEIELENVSDPAQNVYAQSTKVLDENFYTVKFEIQDCRGARVNSRKKCVVLGQRTTLFDFIKHSLQIHFDN